MKNLLKKTKSWEIVTSKLYTRKYKFCKIFRSLRIRGITNTILYTLHYQGDKCNIITNISDVILNEPFFTDLDKDVIDKGILAKILTEANKKTLNHTTTLLLRELQKPKKEIDRKLVNHSRAALKRFYKNYRLNSEQQDILEWCSGKGFKKKKEEALQIPAKYLDFNIKVF